MPAAVALPLHFLPTLTMLLNIKMPSMYMADAFSACADKKVQWRLMQSYYGMAGSYTLTQEYS